MSALGLFAVFFASSGCWACDGLILMAWGLRTPKRCGVSCIIVAFVLRVHLRNEVVISLTSELAIQTFRPSQKEHELDLSLTPQNPTSADTSAKPSGETSS